LLGLRSFRALKASHFGQDPFEVLNASLKALLGNAQRVVALVAIFLDGEPVFALRESVFLVV
jgi:hypothetical protein